MSDERIREIVREGLRRVLSDSPLSPKKTAPSHPPWKKSRAPSEGRLIGRPLPPSTGMNPRMHYVVKCWSLSRRGNGDNTLCACCGSGINRYVRVFKTADGGEVILGKDCANRLTKGGFPTQSYLSDEAVVELRAKGVVL